jgi:hypothetical protein
LGEISSGPPELDEQKKKLGEAIETTEREVFFHRAYANCIRAIGDGIAWRALGYDRAVMRALAQRATKQQVLSEGLVSELHEWSRAFDTREGMAILNALTNCLSIGDITIVRSDGTVEIVEVKTSKTKSCRITRQKKEMRKTVELLNFGEGELENNKIEIQVFDITPENGLSDLLALLQKSERDGWAAGLISNCLYAECLDVRAVKDFNRAVKELEHNRERETAAWRERKDLVLPMGSSDIISYTPNCAPLSIFPFPTRTCVDLLTLSKIYQTFLNVTAISREFVHRGWIIEKPPEELLVEGRDPDDPMLVVRKNGFHAHVPPAYLMQFQMEALRPKVLVAELELKYKMGPRKAPLASFAVYSGEAKIWD